MLNFDALESSRIYHIEDIKKLCVDYRLRFLDSKHFNGTFPAEALDAIKAFEKAQEREITGFKMIAPQVCSNSQKKTKTPCCSFLWAVATTTCWLNGVTICTHCARHWYIRLEISKA